MCFGVAHLDYVTMGQGGGCSHMQVVHEGSVQGPKVLDHEAFIRRADDGMLTRHLGVIEYEIDSFPAQKSLRSDSKPLPGSRPVVEPKL
jgi:hypothetical protein